MIFPFFYFIFIVDLVDTLIFLLACFFHVCCFWRFFTFGQVKKYRAEFVKLILRPQMSQQRQTHVDSTREITVMLTHAELLNLWNLSVLFLAPLRRAICSLRQKSAALAHQRSVRVFAPACTSTRAPLECPPQRSVRIFAPTCTL